MSTPTYLRVGRSVYPVYGDALRGWSPRAADFDGGRGTTVATYRYASLDELFFVLVNLWATASGHAATPRAH